MHQQNPVDAPPESRGTTRIRRTPTESCFHLQRDICVNKLTMISSDDGLSPVLSEPM